MSHKSLTRYILELRAKNERLKAEVERLKKGR